MTKRPPAYARPTALFAFAVGLLVLVAALHYGDALRRNAAWVGALRDWPETRLDARTFDMLVDATKGQPLLLAQVDASGEIALALESCENQANADPARRSAFDLLCNSPYGETIRGDVEAWNAADHFLAVRDNRAKDDRCEGEPDRAEPTHVYLAQGCKPPHWRIERALANGAFALAGLVRGAAPPPQEFGSLVAADPDAPYESDWAFVDGGANEGASFRLATEGVRLTPGHVVTIDVAARAREIDVDYDLGAGGKSLRLPLRADSAISAASENGVEISARRVCANFSPDAEADATIDALQDAGKSQDDCATEPTDGRTPFAYVVRLGLSAKPKGASGVAGLRVMASPMTLRLAALALGRARARNRNAASSAQAALLANANGSFPFNPLGNHIVAHCPLDETKFADCRLAWATREYARPNAAHGAVRVGFVNEPDADLVAGKTAEISERAFGLGLADMLGLDRADYGALTWALAQKRQTRALLSISSVMQEAARATLFGEAETCRRSKAGDPLCLKLQARRHTATIVLMDADREPGAIRAMASWPGLPRHRNIWDLRALEEAEHAGSGLGWRLLTSGERPGSTFKLVTALTAIDAARGKGPPLAPEAREDMTALLEGRMPLRSPKGPDEATFLGLGVGRAIDKTKCRIEKGPPDVAFAPVGPRNASEFWCVRNAARTPFEDEAEVPSGRFCPAGLPGGGKQMGLCEAIKRSSNLFFAGLAHILTIAEPGRPTMALQDAARRLSFDKAPCDSGRPAASRCGFDLTRGLMDGSHAERLRADPVTFDIATGLRNDGQLRKVLSSGFGDAQSATPLAMTTIYASYAKRQWVRPSLLEVDRNGEGCPKAPLQDECRPLADDAFDALARDGLRAVVAEKDGTAFAKFAVPARLRDRVFAKTGTASYRGLVAAPNGRMRAQSLNALWLVGWIEGDGGTGPLGHRLAFGCHVSGAYEKTAGADFCAPAVAQLLKRLDAEPAP